MANKELMITLGLESSSYSQQVKKAKDLNKELDSSFKLLSSSSDKFENSIQGLGKKQEYLAKKMEVASQLTDTYAKRIKESKEALDKARQDSEKYTTEIERLSKIQERVAENLGKESRLYEATSQKIKEKTQLLDKANKAIIANDKRVSEATVGYNQTQESMQKLGREATLTAEKLSAMRADANIKELKEDVSKLDHQFELTKSKVANFGSTMESLGKSQDYYNQKSKLTTTLLEKYNSEITNSSQKIDSYEKDLRDITQEMQTWQELLDSHDMSKESEQYTEARHQLESLRREYSQINQTLEFHKERLDSVSSEYRATEKDLAKIQGSIQSTTEKMKAMNDKVTFEPLSKQVKELANGTVTKLEKQMEQLDNEFNLVTTRVGDLSNSLAGLQIKQTHFNKSLDLARKAFKEYNSELTEVKSKTNQLTQEQKELEQEIEKQIAKLKRLDGAEWDEQLRSVEALKRKYEEVNRDLDLHNKRLNKVQEGYNSSRVKVAQLKNELDSTGKEIDELNRKKLFDGLDKNISDVANRLKMLDSNFSVTASAVDNFDRTKEGLIRTTELYRNKIELLQRQMSNYNSYINSNKQELRELEAQQEKTGNSIYKLKLRMQSLDKDSPEYAKAIAGLARLEKEYEDVSNDIDKFRNDQNRLQEELNQTTVETNELARAQNRLSSEFRANQLDSFSGKLKGIGGGLSALGGSLMGVTYASIGAMGAIGKTGMEFDAQMSKVGALTGETGEELEKTMQVLEDGARNLAKTSRYTATEMAQGLEDMVLAGYSASEAVKTLPLAMEFAQAGSLELATATEDLITSLNSLGSNSELTGDNFENMSVMANQMAITANYTTTDLDGLAKSFVKVGGQVENLKIPLSTANTMLGILGDKGIYAEEAGNSLNSILINLTKAGGESAKAMAELGISAFDANGNIKPIEKTLGEIKKKMEGFDGDKQEVLLTNMLGGKTQAKTLMKLLQGIDAETGEFTDRYKTLKKELEGQIDFSQIEAGNTALSNMSDAMNDNLKGDLAEMTSALQEGAIGIFQKFEPQIREFVQNITKAILEITEKIKNLTPEQLELIASFAKWAVITPIALKFFGVVTSGFGSLASGIGKVVKTVPKIKNAFNVFKAGAGIARGATTAMAGTASAMGTASGAMASTAGSAGFAMKAVGLLGKGFGLLTGSALPWVLAGGAVVATGVAIHKEMSEEVIPTVDLFADKITTTASTVNSNMYSVGQTMTTEVVKISEETKKAVGAYMEMDKGVRQSLFNLYVTSTPITQGIADDMKAKFAEMGNAIKTRISTDAQESLDSMNRLFETSKVLNEQQEAELLTKEAEFYETKKNQITEKENQINAIIQGAKDANRELTQQEHDEIIALQDSMREQAILTLSEQEVEAQVILERMKANDTRLTAEMVSENIKQLNSQRDEAVRIANEEFDNKIRTITRMRDETGVISAETADEMIKEATRQKDETVKKAEETRTEALSKIEQLGKDTYDQVDKDTGKIMSKWDRLFQKWDNWNPFKKKAVIEVDAVTGAGYNQVQNQTGKSISIGVDNSAVDGALMAIRNTEIPTPRIPIPRFDMRNYQTSGGYYNASSVQPKTSKADSSNTALIEALVEQNQLLMQLLSSQKAIEVGVNVDGRQIAKASAKYMDSELNTLSKRKNRLGGLAY